MNLLTINNAIGVLAQTRGGSATGRALGEVLAVQLSSTKDVAGHYTVPQIVAALSAGAKMVLTEAECCALEAVAAARAGC